MPDRALTILGWLVIFSPHITCLVLWVFYLFGIPLFSGFLKP